MVDAASTELRHALRALTRTARSAPSPVLVLAGSVAINTLIFFMLEGVVLRPLPYRAPEALVRVFDSIKNTPKFPPAIGHYLEYRANAKSIDGIALYTGQDLELGDQAVPGSRHGDHARVLLGPRNRACPRARIRGSRHAQERPPRDCQPSPLAEQFGSDPTIVGEIQLGPRRGPSSASRRRLPARGRRTARLCRATASTSGCRSSSRSRPTRP